MSTALTPWLIEPRDTLVVRDARSLAGTNRMKSLGFPLPPSVAGCIRTRLGSATQDWEGTLEVELAGPWLVDRHSGLPLIAAPRDCYWTGAGRQDWDRHRLAPTPMPAGFDSNLPNEVTLVNEPAPGSASASQAKPKSGPDFWWWKDALGWLTAPQSGDAGRLPGPMKALINEDRMHVGIDPQTHAAREGALYSTVGLRFDGAKHEGSEDKARFALGFAVGSGGPGPLTPGLVRLGGEGRISRLAPGTATQMPVPDDALQQALAQHTGTIRVLLLTPGLFAQGWRPSEDTLRRIFGPDARLVAACVDLPLTVSGWEIRINPQRKPGQEKEMGPKASRRAVPAGSVYWVETSLKGPDLIQMAWMQSLCDPDPRIEGEQAIRDGFGRMLLGVG